MAGAADVLGLAVDAAVAGVEQRALDHRQRDVAAAAGLGEERAGQRAARAGVAGADDRVVAPADLALVGHHRRAKARVAEEKAAVLAEDAVLLGELPLAAPDRHLGVADVPRRARPAQHRPAPQLRPRHGELRIDRPQLGAQHLRPRGLDDGHARIKIVLHGGRAGDLGVLLAGAAPLLHQPELQLHPGPQALSYPLSDDSPSAPAQHVDAPSCTSIVREHL